jgi:hypothetical protein
MGENTKNLIKIAGAIVLIGGGYIVYKKFVGDQQELQMEQIYPIDSGQSGSIANLENPDESYVGFDYSIPVMDTPNQSMIPFRYNYPGSDVQDLFDNTQTTPYTNERMDAINGIFPEMLDEAMYGQYDGFLGIGENDTLNGLIPPSAIDWSESTPTPENNLLPGEMDDFWTGQIEMTGGDYQLSPN